jgi:hypothetical protein
MTLQEQFYKALNYFYVNANREEMCEKIAEDLAIKFAESLEGRDLYLERKTIDEAFYDFKKEKQL